MKKAPHSGIPVEAGTPATLEEKVDKLLDATAGPHTGETDAQRTARYDAIPGLGGSRRRPPAEADQRDAVTDMAHAAGLKVVHDSGPCSDGRLMCYGDAVAAHDYLHGTGKRYGGTFAEVWFTTAGEVDRAAMTVNRTPFADVTDAEDNAGLRLFWTLQMLDRILSAPEVQL